MQAAAATASNDGDEQRGRDGAVDDGGAPVNTRPNERVSEVRTGSGSKESKEWRGLEGWSDGDLEVDLAVAGGEFFLVSLTESERGCVGWWGESSGRWGVTGEARGLGATYRRGATAQPRGLLWPVRDGVL